MIGDNQFIEIDYSFIKYNYFAIIGHFISAITMIILLGSKSLVIPYTESYLEWQNTSISEKCALGSREFNTSSGKFCISTVTKPVYCDDDNNCYGIDLGWLIISFHILSFLFQLFASITDYTGPICGYKYTEMVICGKNPLRFVEYGFSASIMLIAIALLNGVTDINLIASIAVLTSACQLCGLVVEYLDDMKLKWILHFNGWLQFFCAYGIIGHAFYKSIESSETGGSPVFVYVIVFALFLLYSLFGFVQFSELIIVLNPITKEKSYVILSLTAKLLLGWTIFSNVLILGN